MFDLEYVGGDYFGVLSSGSAKWRLDSINCTESKCTGFECNSGFGRKWVTALAYDPVLNKFWAGGTGANGYNTMSRWNGNPSNPGLFDGCGTGVVGGDFWHAVRDADLGDHWVSALDTNPVDAKAWMAFMGSKTFAEERGRVKTRDANLALGDEGMPEAEADVVALSFANGAVYATVVNRTDGSYSVYSTYPWFAFQMPVSEMRASAPGMKVKMATPGVVTYPVAINVRDLGGVQSDSQPSTDPAYGLNTVGLLVKITGKVTNHITDDASGEVWFTVDDGSGAVSYYNTASGQSSVKGVKVARNLPASANPGDNVSITGVVSVEKAGEMNQRVVLPRSDAETLTGILPRHFNDPIISPQTQGCAQGVWVQGYGGSGCIGESGRRRYRMRFYGRGRRILA